MSEDMNFIFVLQMNLFTRFSNLFSYACPVYNSTVGYWMSGNGLEYSDETKRVAEYFVTKHVCQTPPDVWYKANVKFHPCIVQSTQYMQVGVTTGKLVCQRIAPGCHSFEIPLPCLDWKKRDLVRGIREVLPTENIQPPTPGDEALPFCPNDKLLSLKIPLFDGSFLLLKFSSVQDCNRFVMQLGQNWSDIMQ